MKKKKSLRDNSEIIKEKKRLLEKVIENTIEYEEKIKKLTDDITIINKKIKIIRKEVDGFDERNQEL